MNDLMELITSSPIDKTLYSFRDEKAILELRELGFDAACKKDYEDLSRRKKHARIAAYNYIVITDEAIQKFLDRKAEIYNVSTKEKEEKRERKYNSYHGLDVGKTIETFMPTGRMAFHYETSLQRPGNEPLKIFSSITKDFNKSTGIGKYIYDEVKHQDYPGIPPRHVLETLKEHKARNLFDYFTIGSVKEIPDPILFGRIEEDKERRWFIAQWGNDVCLDDLI